MPWAPPEQAFKSGGWQPPAAAFQADIYSSPGRKPGQAEANARYLAENEGKTIKGPNVEHSALSLVNEFLQGLPMAARRENERMTGQPISKTLKEIAGKALTAGLPITQIPSMLMAQLEEAKKAYRDFTEGDNIQGTGHALAAALPGIGPAAAQAGEQIAAGDTEGGLARGAGQVMMAAAPAITRGVRAAPSGVRGAYREATAPTQMPTVRVRGVPIQAEAPVPAIVANATSGALVGGGIAAIPGGVSAPVGAAVGAAVGASRPIVRGYRKGTAEFRAAQAQAARPPRTPITAPPSNVPAATTTPVTAPPPAAPGALPSGRRPGGIQNQRTATPSGPAAVDPLDAVAADLGYKKPYSKLTAYQQMEVKVAVKAAEQAAEKIAAPAVEVPAMEAPATPKAPVNTAFKDAFDKAVVRLKEKGEIPQEYEFGKQTDRPAGELARFDMSEAGVPIIDSTKSRFNRPVANPELLKAEQMTQHIDRLAKKPNRTPGETNLLNQLREEVKKRGTK